MKMPVYQIITRNRVDESEPEDIIREQDEKRKILGLDDGNYLCHFFDSGFTTDRTIESQIDNAIQMLAIKEGYDLVQFENGNYGFVAYYDGEANGFEIIGQGELMQWKSQNLI